MARRVLDTTLDTRTARSRLVARGKPYWRQLEPGLAIGYRKPASGAGKWVVRHHLGGRNDYETDTFGVADDLSDPDGEAILSFWQAQTRARERMVARAHIEKETQRSLTVATCIDQYIEFLDTHRKSGREARYAANAFIRPALGKIKLEDLTASQLRKWHNDLTKEGARVRSGKDSPQRFKNNIADPERLRRRKSTANRILTILKGALNRAFKDGFVASDNAWRRVDPFKGVDAARVRCLSIDEAYRFLNAADEDFRQLARGALESGARYGELCELLVVDFNADSGTLSIPDPKTPKPRHIVLGNDGIEFFEAITAGRGGQEPIFLKADGSRWLPDHQADPIRETNTRAKISPPINFHGLRHTWASHAVMNGMPLIVVAKKSRAHDDPNGRAALRSFSAVLCVASGARARAALWREAKHQREKATETAIRIDGELNLMSRKPRKQSEDDNLDALRAALDVFDATAAIGTYPHIDTTIERLRKKCSLPAYAHQKIRREIYQAGKSALGWKHHKTVCHPRKEAATREFFTNLQALVELNKTIQDFDIEQAFSVTHRERNDGSSDPELLDFDVAVERIENDLEEVRTSSKRTAALIEKFTRLTYIPTFKVDGNRINLFTHHFIDHVAMHWPGVFGRPLVKSDLTDMTTLIATSLVDLKYPLSRSQRLSDDWLSDRIRKQIFQN